MADPLSAITGNQQRRQHHTHNSNGSAKSFKSFATAETHPDETGSVTFSRDPAAPSSPFLYEAERSSRSPNKQPSSPSKATLRTKSRSPTKVTLNDLGERIPLTEETLRANEFSLETPRSAQVKNTIASSSSAAHRNYSPSESAFSAFSAIPNADMTAFAKLGLSPSRNEERPSSPTRSRPNTPGTARPNRIRDFDAPVPPTRGEDSNTTALIDFTEQLNMAAQISRSPIRTRNSPSKNSRDQQYQQRDAAGFKPVTPSQARDFLLDFDLPPQPTPRSLPTITPREVESLKAGLLSEISSLKATLQGKDAEISALKAASTDAENRVGAALEQLTEVRNVKESLEQEKEEWRTRDRETQRVLKEVRDQIHATDQERMQMEDALVEAERRAEDAELRAQEAESKSSSAAAGAQALDNDLAGEADVPGSPANKAVQIAVEKVARELHALYKAKHETKVGQLKKSYEARWSKKTDTLKVDIERLEKDLQDTRMELDTSRHEVEEMKLGGGRVDAMTTINPSKLAELQAKDTEINELKAEVDQLKIQVDKIGSENRSAAGNPAPNASAEHASDARARQLEGQNTHLASEIEALRARTKKLARELEQSREENSALVATVDEFLSIDLDEDATRSIIASTVPIPDSAPSSAHPSNAGSRPNSALSCSRFGNRPQHEPMAVPSPVSGHVTGPTHHASSSSLSNGVSAGKPSGLKGPGFGFGQSRIGLGPPPSAAKRSVSGGSRSGIMSNIERMGRGRGVEP